MGNTDSASHHSDETGTGKSARFPETRWSLISDVRGEAEGDRQRALADLCRIYWFPVYAFARRRGCDPHLAEDLTQDLFVKFLSLRSFESADRDRGRLRTYLLTSMSRLMANDVRRQSTVKRSPERFALSIEWDFAEGLLGEMTDHGEKPEDDFDRHWAKALLREVEKRLSDEYAARANAKHFAALKGFLLAPPAEGGYARTAARLGLTEGAVKVAVFRLRKRFKSLLREEISQTVTDHENVDDELRHLYSALAAPGADVGRTE